MADTAVKFVLREGLMHSDGSDAIQSGALLECGDMLRGRVDGGSCLDDSYLMSVKPLTQQLGLEHTQADDPTEPLHASPSRSQALAKSNEAESATHEHIVEDSAAP